MTCVSTFNDIVKELLNKLINDAPTEMEAANLERLKTRFVAAKSMGEDIAISLASPVLVKHAELILSDKAGVHDQFLKVTNFRAQYVAQFGTIKTSDEFLFMLIDSIRSRFLGGNLAVRTDMITTLRSMLTNCLEYELSRC